MGIVDVGCTSWSLSSGVTLDIYFLIPAAKNQNKSRNARNIQQAMQKETVDVSC